MSKKNISSFVSILFFVLMAFCEETAAESSPRSMTESIKTPSFWDAESGDQQAAPQTRSKEEPPKAEIKMATPEQKSADPYPYPGIVLWRNGQWVGSDHLLNIGDKISIAVEILDDVKSQFPLNKTDLANFITNQIHRAGIIPQAIAPEGRPPLPFLHLLVIVGPINGGFAVSITTSLFEGVEMQRVHLSNEVTWQVITWQKQSLIISSKQDIAEQIKVAIDELITEFLMRWRYFKNVESRRS